MSHIAWYEREDPIEYAVRLFVAVYDREPTEQEIAEIREGLEAAGIEMGQ